MLRAFYGDTLESERDENLPAVIEPPATPRDVLLDLPSVDAIAEAANESPLRLLPAIDEYETRFKRWTFLFIALAFVAGYWFFLMSFWVPAPGRPGIDENGYLVGGRNIAEHFTTGFKPQDDFEFVGAMWVRTEHATFTFLPGFLGRWLGVHTEAGWYYPKYPAGGSLLDAIAILIGGREAAFLVSPISTTLALLAMFFLARAIGGSFVGVLAMIVLACGITTLARAINPDSHAPALCMVMWGFYLLVRWWQSGKWPLGAAAGLLLGYAVTIRYTEALLLFPLFPLDQVLSDTNLAHAHPYWWLLIKLVRLLPIGPLGIAVLLSLRWKNLRSYLHAAVPILAWVVPVALLVIFNWLAMGHATGYDTTKESAAFSTREFLSKWDFTIEQLYVFGLFLLTPLGIAGLILMYRSSWRIALLLTLWFVPGTLLYTAYYWGNQAPGVAFLRFFLTLFPPLIIAAVWMLRVAGIGVSASVGKSSGSISAPLATGILVAASAVAGLSASLSDLELEHRGNINLHVSAEHILAKIKPSPQSPPIVFADQGSLPQLLQYMQFMCDGAWYTTDAFELRGGGGFGILGVAQMLQPNQNGPFALQKERVDYMNSILKGKTAADLVQLQHGVMNDALRQGRPIYAVLTKFQATMFRKDFINDEYQMSELDHWFEPCSVVFPTTKNLLTPPLFSGEPFIRWQPQALTLYKISKKAPPPTSSTTKP
jgi:hypothetical protein